MAALDLEKVNEEIVHDLRNADIFSVTVRGVTTTTDAFVATSGQTSFTLSHTFVKNIRSMTVAGVAKYLFRDFTVNWNTGVLTYSAGAVLSDAVSIQFDWSSSGSGDKIYPDWARTDIGLNSMPRIMIESLDDAKPFALGGQVWLSRVVVHIGVMLPANADSTVASSLGGTSDLRDIVKAIRSRLMTQCKSFYLFPYIYPSVRGSITPGTNNRIIQQVHDFVIPFAVE